MPGGQHGQEEEAEVFGKDLQSREGGASGLPEGGSMAHFCGRLFQLV